MRIFCGVMGVSVLLLSGCDSRSLGGTDLMELEDVSCVVDSSTAVSRDEATPAGFTVQQLLDAVPADAVIAVDWSEDSLGLVGETPAELTLADISLDPGSGVYVEQHSPIHPEEEGACQPYLGVSGTMTVSLDGATVPVEIRGEFRVSAGWDGEELGTVLPFIDPDVELTEGYRAAVEARLAEQSRCGDAQVDTAYLSMSGIEGASAALGVMSLECLEDGSDALFRSGGIVAGEVLSVSRL